MALLVRSVRNLGNFLKSLLKSLEKEQRNVDKFVKSLKFLDFQGFNLGSVMSKTHSIYRYYGAFLCGPAAAGKRRPELALLLTTGAV